MPPRCCAPGCPTRSNTSKSLFSVPLGTERDNGHVTGKENDDGPMASTVPMVAASRVSRETHPRHPLATNNALTIGGSVFTVRHSLLKPRLTSEVTEGQRLHALSTTIPSAGQSLLKLQPMMAPAASVEHEVADAITEISEPCSLTVPAGTSLLKPRPILEVTESQRLHEPCSLTVAAGTSILKPRPTSEVAEGQRLHALRTTIPTADQALKLHPLMAPAARVQCEHEVANARAETSEPNRDTASEVKIADLKRKLSLAHHKANKLEEENENLKAGIASYLNADQANCLAKNTMRGSSWSHETVLKALRLKLSCRSQGYNVARELGMPLPSERTLQRKIDGFKFAPGLLTEVMHLLKIKIGELSQQERHAVLMLDEIQISKGMDFDPSTGSVAGQTHCSASEHTARVMLRDTCSCVYVGWNLDEMETGHCI
ncbi:hypothetical protein MTO96_025166 [Rhipicephalus appendiculatus]